MSRNKDRKAKHREYASRMARGDTGRNYLNEFFGVVNHSVDGMLYEFGLLNDKKKAFPSRKPLPNRSEERPPTEP